MKKRGLHGFSMLKMYKSLDSESFDSIYISDKFTIAFPV